MSHPLHLLVVEDSPDDADLLVHQLRRAEFDPHWCSVDTETDFLAQLHSGLDVIIADFNVPGFSGLRALTLLQESGLDIPLIMVSGFMSEKRAAEAMRAGASDYLMKDRPERLGFAVAQALEKSRLRRGFKQAEQALQEGERKFRALFDAAHDAIYMLRNGVFVDCNTKGQFMYGRTWAQIVGHTPDEFAPPAQPDGRDTREKAFEIVSRALAGEPQFFEWTSRHLNGDSVVTEISLNRIELGGEVFLMAVARDITERRRAAEQIADQAALLDRAQDAIAIRDLDGNVTFWNKGAERIYGWSHEEVMGSNLNDFIHADPAAFDEINRLVMQEGDWSGEVRHLTKDGRELTIEARWTLLRDKDGRPKSMMTINTDVTEKKMMEAQLMRSQRMESIGTLAGGIAHDLNNILTPILTSIELLKLREIDPRARHILDTIEASSRRGADIVRQVLSFARGIKGKLVEVQPRRLLGDIETLIQDTFPKNIRLQALLPREVWAVRGDPTQLHQVLLNLCVNARDAMPQGGLLTVAVENTVLDAGERRHLAQGRTVPPPPAPSHRAEQVVAAANGNYDRARFVPQTKFVRHLDRNPGRYVRFTITDSGNGIPQDQLDHIFEPFFTTKEVGKGTGLGLSTVLAIVKSHEGFVDVRSAPDIGTIFRIFLPAMDAPMAQTESGPSLASLPHGEGETILIIDDEPSILAVSGDTLEAFGYHAIIAQDGAEALAIYEARRGEISAVLTDMTMPIMDGTATIQRLLEMNPALKIIASSGFMTRSGTNSAAVAGGKHFLAKPYTAETLLKTIRAALDDTPAIPAA